MANRNIQDKSKKNFAEDSFDSEKEKPLIGRTKKREDSADALAPNMGKNNLLFPENKQITFSSNRRK